MVTELTNWADATKVSGYDYVWAISDNINVSATADISGLNLIFSSTKRIYASAGGTITVSNDFVDRYIYPTKITVKQASDTDINLVVGTGKWVGKGLTFAVESGNLRFDSNTSQTQLRDLSVDALISSVSALRVLLHNAGEINLYRITGMTVIRYGGILSMNPRGIGLVSSQSYGAAKLVAINATFPGFVISSDATHRTQTASSAYNATTMTFVDGKVNPEFLDAYPKDNDAVIRLIKRTITFKPVSNDGSNVSGFKYRISSNRVLQPAGTTTTNFTIVQNTSADFNGTYLLTVWRGTRPTGTDTYNPLRDRTIDKDMRVQYRKYGLREAIFSSNSYNFAVDAPAIMATDEFVSTNPVIFNTLVNASQFYDSVRSGCATYLDFPEDLLITDGKVLTIKSDWKLKRSATATSSVITVATKEIVIDKDSYLGKMNTGIFKFDTIAGFVDDSMTGHTNMVFARQDGKANLNLQITCPAGSLDPVAGVWLFSQGLDNRAGMITGQTTGTGVQNITLLVEATDKYYCTVKALGSNQYVPFVVDPVGGLGASKDITLFGYEKNDGTPLLPTSLTPAETAIADTFQFHGTHIEISIPDGFATNPRWSSADKIWQYKASDFIPLAYKLDVIQTALILLGRNQLMFLQEGRILISATANAKILDQDPDNKTTVGSTTNVKISLTTISIGRIGDTDGRNTFIENENGTIDVRGGVPINGGFSIADANRLIDTNTKVTAVKTETDKLPAIQTKADETHQRLALDRAKPLTSKPDGGITSTGIAITATELADGSVVQTRGT